MHGWLGGIGALIVFVLLVWGLFLVAGVLTVKAHADLDSQVTAMGVIIATYAPAEA